MKKTLATMLLFLLVCPGLARSEQFLGLDLPPQGAKIKAEEDRLELSYPMSPEGVLDFYKGALGKDEDVRFRRWGDSHIVEDFGVRPWNRILVTEVSPGQTKVVITKDSWFWILNMLALRLLGVFVVLLCLYLATILVTGIFRRSVRKRPELTS